MSQVYSLLISVPKYHIVCHLLKKLVYNQGWNKRFDGMYSYSKYKQQSSDSGFIQESNMMSPR